MWDLAQQHSIRPAYDTRYSSGRAATRTLLGAEHCMLGKSRQTSVPTAVPNVGTRSCKTTFTTSPCTLCDIFLVTPRTAARLAPGAACLKTRALFASPANCRLNPSKLVSRNHFADLLFAWFEKLLERFHPTSKPSRDNLGMTHAKLRLHKISDTNWLDFGFDGFGAGNFHRL